MNPPPDWKSTPAAVSPLPPPFSGRGKGIVGKIIMSWGTLRVITPWDSLVRNTAPFNSLLSEVRTLPDTIVSWSREKRETSPSGWK